MITQIELYYTYDFIFSNSNMNLKKNQNTFLKNKILGERSNEIKVIRPHFQRLMKFGVKKATFPLFHSADSFFSARGRSVSLLCGARSFSLPPQIL